MVNLASLDPEAPHRVAVVGAGISGLTCAHALTQHTAWDVTVFEARTRLGGHADTQYIEGLDEPSFPVDTGFIVFNDRNYPNFRRLIGDLGLQPTPTNMSFSVSLPGPSGAGAFEYNGGGIRGLFAQPSNVLRPRFWRLLRGIVRFNGLARQALKDPAQGDRSLGSWLAEHGFGEDVVNRYLLPMAGAVWSASPERIRDFPIGSLFHFLDNHGLLELNNRPQWYSLRGGSQTYVRALADTTPAKFVIGDPVLSVHRTEQGVEVRRAEGQHDHFDALVMACHGDDALSLLGDSDALEEELLGAFKYSENRVYLHSDPSHMPVRKAAWACWNYMGTGTAEDDPIAVSYWMNALQELTTERLMVVTLNPSTEPLHVHRQLTYRHPQFDAPARQAQKRRGELQGHRRVWYAGAHWRWGFHEDGVVSGLTAVQSMGAPVTMLGEMEG